MRGGSSDHAKNPNPVFILHGWVRVKTMVGFSGVLSFNVCCIWIFFLINLILKKKK
jgi:hypothetical protein